jgi:SAM-dependent methyltransferase
MNYPEIIAAFGEGSAHPGGFQSTLKLLECYPIKAGARILEVGGGTGRTACHLAAAGCHVTVVEQNTHMLDKAIQRASMMDVAVDFIQGDIQSLPFHEESYDIVFAESVTIFTEIEVTLREYYRVLKHGGRLLDRELAQAKTHPSLLSELNKLYGASVLPSKEEWASGMDSAGFINIREWIPASNPSSFLYASTQEWIPDPHQVMDIDKLQNPLLAEFSQRNHSFLHRFQDYMSYGVFIAEK